MLNVRGGSPEAHKPAKDGSPKTEETLSDDTDYSTDKSGEERRDRRREKRDRKAARNRCRDMRRVIEINRENKNKMVEQQPKDSGQLCVYYLQGKCQKVCCSFVVIYFGVIWFFKNREKTVSIRTNHNRP